MPVAAADIVALESIRKDDILIAFMGPTGVGKSTFIDLLAGQNKRAGNSLKSHTDKVQAIRVRRPGGDDRFVLIDTPGFDDTNKPDMIILQMIGDWLEKTYKKRLKLTGLVYLHRITDNRMAGSPLRNLRMFGQLCGDVAMDQVILVTTMWEKLIGNVKVADGREKELVDKFWQPMIARGSKVERLSRATPDEAWRIVDRVIQLKNERHAVLLQEELVELQLKLNETQAGQLLYDSLQKLLSDQKKALKAVLEQINKSGDDNEIAKELQAELRKIDEQFQKTFDQVKGLKITIGQRIKRFFSFKKAQARAVKIPVAE